MTEEQAVALVKAVIGNPIGQCYPASEAVYHLVTEQGYTPVRGGGHWWLRRNTDGSVLDVTAEQYPDGFDYSVGRGGGFLTRQPSKRARAIIDKVIERVRNSEIPIPN